ncbi:CubicO group peptidase (beta-lactamase class C family) [Ureibacillus xyleni]|uniref:CubicO group peptidase (Beta-lactamase class C family) n=1 Tax=Ureibacillus xyleni TaxID=614648 RepID=A0A285SKR9_9BACL|nr:serine hydrolase [Ureibacillus xyleni]SOC08179.1 CubicO group peptidase (beta-lactamase class C family) [Ureibacillus xyleni]
MRKILSVLFSLCLLIFTVNPTNAASMETPSGIVFDNLEKEIDSYVEEYINQSSPGAAVAIVKDGEIIFSKGYGYANVSKKEEIDPAKTVFEYGSISKLFVWTSIMQLVEQGKIELNRDIKTYLPQEFSNQLNYEKTITIYDLMHHTAGFEEYPFDLIYTSKEEVVPLKELLVNGQPKQIYDPGSTIAYSNYATAIAGYIVEEISGSEFSEYERDNIFKKANMMKTSGHPVLEDYPELEQDKATGYIKVKEEFIEAGWSYVPLYPAGSVNGTLHDLANFAIALMPNNKDNSPLFKTRETLDNMLSQSGTPHTEILSNAHGFWEYDGQVRGVGHGGNTLAFSSNMVIAPEENFGVIVLTNAAGEMDLCYGLVDLLMGKRDKQIPVSVTEIQLPSAKEIEGSYVSARNSESSYVEGFLGFMTMAKVKAVSENEIKVTSMGMEGSYVQTSPYLYEVVGKSLIGDKLYFEIVDGELKRISTGQIADYLPLKWDRQLIWYYISIGILGLSLLYFIIGLIVSGVSWLRNRKKNLSGLIKTERKWHSAIILVGAMFIINNLFLIVRTFSGMSIKIDVIKWHIICNWALLAGAIICMLISFLYTKRAPLQRKQKSIRLSTWVILVLLVIVLINWNFFNIIA